MRRPLISLVALIAAIGLVVAGCGQAAPAGGSGKKVDFPQKGKAITVVVPWGTGGGSDVGARLLMAALEKQLGTPIEVTNKTGGSGQVGTTEVANAKPDGYTIGMTNLPATILQYIDAERKAPYTGKSFQPIAMHDFDPNVLAVKPDSRYKSLKDLVDAAKANPGQVKISLSGFWSAGHFGVLRLEKMAGIKLAYLQFDQQGQQRAALLGGHVDAELNSVSEIVPAVKSGEIKGLTIMADEESKFLPGVKTTKSEGFNLVAATSRAYSAPAGTPMDAVNVISSGIKGVMESAEYKKKADDIGMTLRYLDAAQLATYWTQQDAEIKPIFEEAKRATK